MTYLLPLLVLLLQCGLTFIIFLTLYMVSGLMDYQGGVERLIVTTFLQPIFGGILSGILILLCLTMGFPIRFNKKLVTWWTSHFYLRIVGLILGFCMLFVAILPSNREIVSAVIEDQQTLKEIPNTTMLSFGWFVIAFFAVHTLPSSKIVNTIQKFINKF